jgi:hypothetical protein
MPTLDELYSYHAFSKAPVDGQSLAQSVNKAGHTITSKDVWAEKIPHIFKIDKDSNEERNNLPAKVNDLACFVATNKFWIFDGSSWTEISLTNGDNVPTKDGTESTIRYYSDELTALTSENNAGAHSNGFAWRYFNDEGSPSFIAPTDSFDEKGLPALGYNVIIKENDSPITDGIDCYVDYYSGTVFFDKKKRTAPSKVSLSFFTYIGEKLDTVLNEKSNSSGDVSNIDINSFIDSREDYKTDKDLWGNGVFPVENEENKIKIAHEWISTTNDLNEKTNIVFVTTDKVYKKDSDDEEVRPEFYYNLETKALKDGSYGFKNCEKLTYFDGDLSNMEIAVSMFEGAKNLSTFAAQMPNLIKADNMFKGCESLTNFNCKLTNLKNADFMFRDCSNLESFTADARTIHTARRMFENAEKLVSFSAPLRYLYSGRNMFKNTNLTNINTSLNSLLDGNGMFENTRLSYYAIEKIAKTLPAINGTITENIAKEGEPENWVTYKQWDNDSYVVYNTKLWSSTINDTFYYLECAGADRESIGEITITWKEVLDEEGNFDCYEYDKFIDNDQKATIYYELFELMKLKGWTIITNLVDPSDSNRTLTPKYARLYSIGKNAAETATDTSNIYTFTITLDDKTITKYYELVKAIEVIEPETYYSKCKDSWWVKINDEDTENDIKTNIQNLMSERIGQTITLTKYESI